MPIRKNKIEYFNFGEKIERTTMTYQYRITLADTNPLVWRRILIPDNFTLYEFHKAIHAAFGWWNSHLFQFSINGMGDLTAYQEILEDKDRFMLDEGNIIDAR